MSGTEDGFLKGRDAEDGRAPEALASGHMVKSHMTVIQVDGELLRICTVIDTIPEGLTFTSALF